MFGWQKARLIAITQPVADEFGEKGTAEDLISFCARVSSPDNQTNFDSAGKLLKYCMRKKHWSIFEQADLTFEIITTREIGRQLLRHQHQPQEFSGRYSVHESFVTNKQARIQDNKNRQNSIVPDTNELQEWWTEVQSKLVLEINQKYQEALSRGMAKECARAILPEGLTISRMYLKNNLRGWFHYCQLRMIEGETQLEHVDIARKIWHLVKQEFPFINEIEASMKKDAINDAMKLLQDNGYTIS